MTDERRDSLAAQAASWVPPWERIHREPDRAYQAAATEPDISDEMDEEVDASAPTSPAAADRETPDELRQLPGEVPGAATVDSPTELPEEFESPTEVGIGPDLVQPPAVEDAEEEAPEDEPGEPVDAPLPSDGDDAWEAEPSAPGGEGMAGAALGAIPVQGRSGRDPDGAVGADDARTDNDLGPAPLEDSELRAALEAILLVVDEPVAEMHLAQITEQATERVAAMLEDISARYTAAGHGFDLRRAAGGWRLYTRPEYAAYVERFVLDGQSVRLTQAALETLAVVAYKQPVTRSRISAIRGVNCDAVMRTLATRGLIEECGTEPETGAHLYRTTGLFLEKLGLNSVDQLPPLAPFLPDDVEEVLDASG